MEASHLIYFSLPFLQKYYQLKKPLCPLEDKIVEDKNYVVRKKNLVVSKIKKIEDASKEFEISKLNHYRIFNIWETF